MIVMYVRSWQNHRHEVIDGRVGGGGGLGSHQYIHNTPADYKYERISLHWQPHLSLFIQMLVIRYVEFRISNLWNLQRSSSLRLGRRRYARQQVCGASYPLRSVLGESSGFCHRHTQCVAVHHLAICSWVFRDMSSVSS